MASETVSRLVRSRAVCQPGLYSRLPVTPTRPARSPELVEPVERARHFVLPAHDADEVLHHVLQIVLDLIRAFAVGAALERRRAPFGAAPSICAASIGPAGCSFANCAANSPARLPKTSRSESELPPSRLAPLMPAAHSPAANKPGHAGHLRVGIHADAAHDVMRGRADFHRLARDVDVGQLLELVIHARQLALDVLGGVRELFFDPGDVEKDAAVRAAAAFLDFAHDAAGDVIAREQFRRTARVLVALAIAPAFLCVVGGLRFVVVGDVAEHEALALLVEQDAAFAAHAFGDENAHARSAARPCRWDGTGRTPCRSIPRPRDRRARGRRRCIPNCCW